MSLFSFHAAQPRRVPTSRRHLRVVPEQGQATAEYAVVILVAVALGMAVLGLFTGGAFNALLGDLIKGVLKMAIAGIN